ncbi:Y-family DNA polymerase [Flavobacterium aquatile]|uniref:SOS mutagenesis and repair protein UmuC n=1 Tax=Flavobacterium aquatile LMG 4008 = ATCC 11947 TaxID=1453498 RepID=A0A095SWM2_9FLAO|nr:Y-family DNA polymerase [Flavobacterium aquatile]KGD69061.1 SOS mutagenesis and repair protein UmuC [Flavobacterium aquatile LMG 4008 = ATCC 11947]OXA65774.1 SOS mutagenesis and repair protein UmuC [Flavobacterium aquatile LMG 4008 = ATCC 11947]GEC78081.1 SOS mutagenesis and repair protein UmuC [Flavobacterium aquatile]
MYALVDCNNFYASCERVFQPQFIGKPVVILSNNDGCVISRSNEAKDLGIPMGAPEFKIRELLKEKNIKVFSSNYPLYGDLSNRVMKILEGFTPNVEIYSIDEAFLNFDGMSVSDYHNYGIQMKSRVQKWVGIPVCVGFAPTKALSKVANRIAKKFQDRTQGIYVIDTEEKRIKALKWTKIEDVWGIGFRLRKKMIAHNILTAYDFTKPQHEAWIRKEMGVIGMRLKYELEGKSVLDLEPIREQKKSIATTRSFPKQISEFDDLRERVATFSAVCTEKLRKQKSCCQTIIVMLVIDKHKYESQKYYFNKAVTLPYATNSTLTISNVAISMLKDLYKGNEGIKFKKAGVIVTELIDEDKKQLQLFEEENPKHLAIMKAMDFLNTKIGDRKVKLGTQNLGLTWNMNQNHLSPRFTTRFNEILEIKCH